MKKTMLETVVEKLQEQHAKHGSSVWLQLHKATGVPRTTIYRIGTGETKRPGIDAIEPLYNYLTTT